MFGESMFGGIIGFYLAKRYFHKYYNQPKLSQIFGSLGQQREAINTSTSDSSEKFQPHQFLNK